MSSLSSLPAAVFRMNEKTTKQLTVLFNISYFILMKDRPLSDSRDLASLHQKNGVELIEQYVNDKQCREFIRCISQSQRQLQLDRINNKTFQFSIMLDASTDSSQHENVIFYIRYCSDEETKPVTEFFAFESLPGGDAALYMKVLEDTLTDWGLQDWKQRLIALGTDGCNAMRGVHNGLAARIERQVAGVTTIHYIAHNLQLVILDASRDVPYLREKFEPTSKKLFNFYYYSP